MDFDINAFDVLINNYCARLCFDWYLNPDYVRAVLSFQGLKIAIAQDEYDRTGVLHSSIRRLGFHVLFTSVPKKCWPFAYPALQVPGVALREVLTGYVPAFRPAWPIKPLAERRFPIGYRGRRIGARYGRLGFEKYEIGRYMAELCDSLQQPHNISTDEGSRIYGDAWFEFVSDCKSMLGSESGSNVFDFDLDIEREVERFKTEHGRNAEYSDLAEFLAPFEEPFDVGQISPRVFECALMKTPMILFRGRYSGALLPDVHYIPLEKDFSNARAVLARLENLDYLKGFAERSYDHLIASGKYNYGTLTAELESVISEYLPRIVGDPAIQHRRLNRQPWSFSHDRHDPRSIALSERPTDMPQSPADFSAKHEHLQQLNRARLSGVEMPAVEMPAVEMPAVEMPGSAFAMRAWRSLPGPLREKLRPVVQQILKTR